jgi:hypothetical protein
VSTYTGYYGVTVDLNGTAVPAFSKYLRFEGTTVPIDSFTFGFDFDAVGIATPLLPTSSTGGTFVFNAAPSRQWFDPPATDGYFYEMTGGSLFTSILGFPTGFTSPFEVYSGGSYLGSFSPGDTLSFSGGGVSSFTIKGIDPTVDSGDPLAFPLQLEFNTPTADFTMTALPPTTGTVPDSGTSAYLLAISLVFVGVARRRLPGQ